MCVGGELQISCCVDHANDVGLEGVSLDTKHQGAGTSHGASLTREVRTLQDERVCTLQVVYNLEGEAEQIMADFGVNLVDVQSKLHDDLSVSLGGPISVSLLGLECLLALE